MKKAPILILSAVILVLVVCVITLIGRNNELSARVEYQSTVQQEQSEQLLESAGNQASLGSQVETLTQENQKLTQLLEESQDKLLAAEAETAAANEQLETAQAEFQRKLDGAKQEIVMLSNIQQELNNQLTAQKSANQQDLEESQKQLEAANNALTTALEENARLTAKAAEDQESITRLNAELAASKADAESAQSKVAGLTDSVTALEQRLQQAEADYALLEGTVGALQESAVEQERMIAALSVPVQEPHTGDTAQMLDELRAENERLTRMCETLQFQLQPAQEEAESLRADNLQLQARLQALAELGVTDADDLLRLLNGYQQEQPVQGLPEVSQLLVTCVNRFEKKTYFRVTPEEALLLKVAPETVYIQIRLLDSYGNGIPFEKQ